MAGVNIDDILHRSDSSPRPAVVNRRQSLVAQVVDNWGAEYPFGSLSHDMIEYNQEVLVF